MLENYIMVLSSAKCKLRRTVFTAVVPFGTNTTSSIGAPKSDAAAARDLFSSSGIVMYGSERASTRTCKSSLITAYQDGERSIRSMIQWSVRWIKGEMLGAHCRAECRRLNAVI